MNEITIFRGDTLDMTVSVATMNNEDFDLTGYTAKLTVKESDRDDDADAILQVAGTPDVETSTISFSLSTDDTEVEPGSYLYDIEIANSTTEKVHTIVADSFIVKPDITRS